METLKTFAPVWMALLGTVTLLFGAGLYNTYYSKRYIVYQTFFPPSGAILLQLKNISQETCTKPGVKFRLSQGRITSGKLASTSEPADAVVRVDASKTEVILTTQRLAAAGSVTLELRYEGGSNNGVELVPEPIACDNGAFYLSKDIAGGWSFSGPVLVALGLSSAGILLLGVVLGLQRML